ncbi:MAG TPA: hypothetical protein VN380_03055 [Thermoanaerobaculia bacterium]|jgi:hypothetical protein|nr:hypothetical protein [Thermoanaerobaculia bacterium]
MPDFEIYFSGLICHVGSSEKEGSERITLVSSIIIPDDNNYHVPRILTSAGMTTRTDVTAPDISLLGEKLYTGVTFTNLGAGANALNLFRDSVPHLDDLTRSGVSLHPTPPGLKVQLPFGSFTVVAFYQYGAKWVLDDDTTLIQTCVPRVTMLKATGSNVTVNFNGQEVPLSQDGGWVLITNLEPRIALPAGQPVPPGYHPGDDWKKQHIVTTGDANDIADYYDLNPSSLLGPAELVAACKRQPPLGRFTKEVLKVVLGAPITDSSECTNSHWP